MDDEEFVVDDPEELSGELGAPSTSKGVKRPRKQTTQKLFQLKWLEEPEFRGWLHAVTNDKNAARCVACNQTIMGGKSEIQRHAARAKHQKSVLSLKGMRTLEKSFQSNEDVTAKKHEEDVKTMEVLLSTFFAQNNVAFQTAESLIEVIKKGAKDSKIVKDVTLGRFKCSSIVRNVIAKTETEDLVKDLQRTVFSVMIDESTDISNEKNMCILVRYVSPDSKNLRTNLLELVRLDSRDCSAAALWSAFEECLTKNHVPVENIVGFASDNASVMTGHKDSFWTRLKSACPWAILLPCICHSSAIITREACKTLPSFVEDVLRGISSYMHKSPKRCAELRDFQLYDEEVKKVLKPSNTRWLVMHSCISRYLGSADSLLGYFRTQLRENPKDREARKIFSDMSNPFTTAYFHFLDYSMNYFNEFNAMFQARGVLIHRLASASRQLLVKLCQNFIKPQELKAIETVNVSHPSNQLPLDMLYLGPACTKYLENLTIPAEPGKAPVSKAELEQHKKAFRLKCFAFYIEAAKQMQARLPLSGRLYQEMSFVDPQVLLSAEKRVEADGLADLSALGLNFKDKLSLDMNALAVEWRTVPLEFTGSLRERLLEMPPEDAWKEIASLKNFKDEFVFPNLTKLASCVLSLPHSNADAERIFSIVTDVKTKKRNRMGAENLNSIAVTRASFASKGIDCKVFEVRKSHLEKFNAAIYKSKD